MFLLNWKYICFGNDHNTHYLLFMFPVGYPLTVNGDMEHILILVGKNNFFIGYLLYYYYCIFYYQHYYKYYTSNYCVEFKINFEININLSVKNRMMK